MEQKKLWFKRKRYGWGWTPATWQGWAVVSVYIVLLLALVSSIDKNASPREVAMMGFLPLIILTALLIRISYKKGERPRWQWGKDVSDSGTQDQQPS